MTGRKAPRKPKLSYSKRPIFAMLPKDKPTDAEREYMRHSKAAFNDKAKGWFYLNERSVDVVKAGRFGTTITSVSTKRLLNALERAGILRRAGWVRK